MTPFYRFLQLTVRPLVGVFFGDVKNYNYDNVPKDAPILFVGNHPSAMMDPLVCGACIEKPIYFLGRADLFKSKFNNWFLRNAHMWPIYRSVDGKDSVEKNKEVFAECYESLKEGNPILLYGEGFTDESFIRRVKKIKKGAARIGFGAEEAYDFKMNLHIVPIGMNYTNPAKSESDFLMRYAEPIRIADYEEQYKENPVKAIVKVTNIIESRIQSNIVHANKKEEFPSYEKAIMLFEDSMHYTTEDSGYPLTQRWDRSKQIYNRLNELSDESRSELLGRVNDLWSKIKGEGEELFIIQKLNDKRVTTLDLPELIFMFPVTLLGWLLNGLTFVLLSTLPEKLAKRPCFYSGMRLAFAIVLVPLIALINYLIIEIWVDSVALFPLVLGLSLLTGAYALRYKRIWRRVKSKWRARKIVSALNLDSIKKEYNDLKTSLIND